MVYQDFPGGRGLQGVLEAFRTVEGVAVQQEHEVGFPDTGFGLFGIPVLKEVGDLRGKDELQSAGVSENTQQTSFLPRESRARARPVVAPRASPSGCVWPTMATLAALCVKALRVCMLSCWIISMGKTFCDGKFTKDYCF